MKYMLVEDQLPKKTTSNLMKTQQKSTKDHQQQQEAVCVAISSPIR